MKKYSLLLLSGGVGSRTALDYPKQFHKIKGHPMLVYSLIAARKVREIDEFVINYPEGCEGITREIIGSYFPDMAVKFVPCGETRHQSTKLLLEAAKNFDVIVHEAARPIIGASGFRNLIKHEASNVAYCLPIPFSMCEVDLDSMEMVRRVDRSTTMNIQLPQKFSKRELTHAHEKATELDVVFTEDAMLVREVGNVPVKFMLGWEKNIKVTTREDFVFAESFLKETYDND